VKVRFFGGDPAVQRKVAYYAQEWTQYSGIRFVFGDDPDANIRISFDPATGSWSYVGSCQNDLKPSDATMNFGWLTPDTDDAEYARVVLHEFGHALGLLHEHQNPAGGISWNEPAVYAYYRRTQGWSNDKTYQNVIAKYRENETNHTAYDPQSIMQYPIPKELTLNGFQVGWNRGLSDTDKQFIRDQYGSSISSAPRPMAADSTRPTSHEDTRATQIGSPPHLPRTLPAGHAQSLDVAAVSTRPGVSQASPALAAGRLTGFVERHPLWVDLQTLRNDTRMSRVEPVTKKAIEVDFGRLRDRRSQLLPQAGGLDSEDDLLMADYARQTEERRGLDAEFADLSSRIADHNSRCNPAPDDATYQQCVAEGAQLNARRDQYNNKVADFNARLTSYTTQREQLQRAWGAFLQSVDLWGVEIQALIDRIQKEFASADTGDCTEEQHRRLQDEVDRACKRPRACKGDMECAELRENLRKSRECYDARKTINDTCFKGGDVGHKKALEEAQNAINNCLDLIPEKCDAGVGLLNDPNDFGPGSIVAAAACRDGIFFGSLSGR
jgi:hypothetical protein